MCKGFHQEGKRGGSPSSPLIPKIPKICLLLDIALIKKLSPPFPTCPLKEYIDKFYPQFQEHNNDLLEKVHWK